MTTYSYLCKAAVLTSGGLYYIIPYKFVCFGDISANMLVTIHISQMVVIYNLITFIHFIYKTLLVLNFLLYSLNVAP